MNGEVILPDLEAESKPHLESLCFRAPLRARRRCLAMKLPSCTIPSSGLSASSLRGVLISLALLFVAESSRGMVVSNLFQYFVSVSGKNNADHFQPLAVSAYSFGRLIAAPVFGFFIDRYPIK